MLLKDEWKKTGKNLGSAMAGLGKALGHSAKTVFCDDEESDAFTDGTWRKTGKDLGGAFKGLAKSVVHSVKNGIDNLDNDDASENNDSNDNEDK